MMGSALIGFLGGIHHWWPKMTGKMYHENWGRVSAILVFIGFNVTFFSQFMMGSKGMPRRYATYIEMPEFQIYHIWSTAGSVILAVGFVICAIYLLHSIFAGKKAPANPWGGRSLEWQCTSPPPWDNFAEQPEVGDCYDYSVLEWNEEEQGYDWKKDVAHPGDEQQG
jgi:cytochrome c oxidase subunit 1